MTSDLHLASEPNVPVLILIVSPCADDVMSLRRILDHPNWRLHWSRSCGEALEFLGAHEVAAIVSDRDQVDGSWVDLINSLKLERPPAVIVFSRLADERLWAEVLNLGGWDVLATPFVDDEVLWAAGSAWRSWNLQGRESQSRSAELVQTAGHAA